MPSLWERLFGRPAERESSAQAAKRRLQFVLVHDRINLPPDIMAAMKQEILDVISKYVQVSEDSIDIALHPSEAAASTGWWPRCLSPRASSLRPHP